MNQDVSPLFSSGTFLSPRFAGCLPKGFWVFFKYMISPNFFWHGYFQRNPWFYWPSMLRNHYAISCNLLNVFATVCVCIYIYQNICILVCSYIVYNPPITGVCCATNLLPATTTVDSWQAPVLPHPARDDGSSWQSQVMMLVTLTHVFPGEEGPWLRGCKLIPLIGLDQQPRGEFWGSWL